MTLKLSQSEVEKLEGKSVYYRLENNGAQMFGQFVQADLEAEVPYVCVTFDPNDPNARQCYSLDSFRYIRPVTNRHADEVEEGEDEPAAKVEALQPIQAPKTVGRPKVPPRTR